MDGSQTSDDNSIVINLCSYVRICVYEIAETTVNQPLFSATRRPCAAVLLQRPEGAP